MEMVMFDIISILHGLIFPFVMNIETAFFFQDHDSIFGTVFLSLPYGYPYLRTL